MADVHVLLCFAVAGCSVATVAEGALHGSGAFAPTVARVFFTLLQGTWFCQAAHILYGACSSLRCASACWRAVTSRAGASRRAQAVGSCGRRQQHDAAGCVHCARACRRASVP